MSELKKYEMQKCPHENEVQFCTFCKMILCDECSKIHREHGHQSVPIAKISTDSKIDMEKISQKRKEVLESWLRKIKKVESQQLAELEQAMSKLKKAQEVQEAIFINSFQKMKTDIQEQIERIENIIKKSLEECGIAQDFALIKSSKERKYEKESMLIYGQNKQIYVILLADFQSEIEKCSEDIQNKSKTFYLKLKQLLRNYYRHRGSLQINYYQLLSRISGQSIFTFFQKRDM